MGGQRGAWLQGQHSCRGWKDTRQEDSAETCVELHEVGGQEGQQGQLPCNGDGTEWCWQSHEGCLALSLWPTGITVPGAPRKPAEGCW